MKEERALVLSEIEQNGLIIIVRGVDEDRVYRLFDALYEGGVRVAEFTFEYFDDQKTFGILQKLCERYRGKMQIGAGTVLKANQVELAKTAGCSFIVSPGCFKEVIEKASVLNIATVTGALTPTEIMQTKRLGCEMIKIFPSDTLGPDYVKSVSAPFSKTKFVAFGGVNFENCERYLKAGCVAVGVGSCVADKQLISDGNFKEIAYRARMMTELIARVKAQKA